MLAVPQPKLPVPNDLLPKPFPPASRFPSSPLLRLRPLLYLVSADSLLPGWSCLLRFSGSSLLLHQQLLQRPLQRQQQKQQQHPHFSFLSTAASASFISSSSSSSSSFGSSKKSGVGKLLESQVPPPPSSASVSWSPTRFSLSSLGSPWSLFCKTTSDYTIPTRRIRRRSTVS